MGVEFNQQDNNQNSVVSIENGRVTLSHTTLSTPCFISPKHYMQTPNLARLCMGKWSI
jgi:hypothetical protein